MRDVLVAGEGRHGEAADRARGLGLAVQVIALDHLH
jgi:hypothetical protein